MASKYDEIRKNRIRQGQEAKERVMSGIYRQPVSSPASEQTSKYDSIRNRSRDLVGSAPVEINQDVRALAPDLFNPFKQIQDLKRRLQTPIPDASKPVETTDTAASQRQQKAEQAPLTRLARGTQNLLARIVPGNFGEQKIERPIEQIGDVVRATEIPGVTTPNPVTNFLRGAGDTATFGLSSYLDRSMGLPERAEGATETTAGKIGQIAGGLALPAGNIRAGVSLVSNIGRGAAAGALLGAGVEAGEALTGRNDQSLGQRALDVGISTALGGAGGAAGDLLLRGVNRLQRGRTTQPIPIPERSQQTPQLPSPRVESQAVQAPAAQAQKGDWFTNLFGKQGVGITPALNRNRRNLATTEGQIVDNPLRRDAQGTIAEVQAAGRAAYQNLVDLTAPLKHIDARTYDAAQDVRRANNLANTIVQDKFVDPQGNVIGAGLKEILNKVARGRGPEFEDYLILRHSLTRMARGERVYDPKLNMTPEKVQQRIDMLEQRYPEFRGIANEWDQYTENLLRVYGEQEGLLSAAQVDALRQANPNYAPMRRQFSLSEKYSQPFAMRTNSFSGQKAPIKEVSPTGSARKIVSPVRSIIEATGAWTNAAMRNRVMQTIVDKLRQDPESLKGIISFVDESADATKKSLDEINDILNKDGMEGLLEHLNDEFALLFKSAKQKGARTDNIVTAMVNGQPIKMRVENPEVFKALVGLGPQETNLVLDALGALSKATKFGATGPLAPLFAARSLSTDVIQSMIQSKQPLMHLYDLGYAILSSLANQLPKNTPGFNALRSLAEDFARTGGEYSAILMGDRALNRSVRNLLRDPILSGRNIARAAVSPITGTFRVLHRISDISENLNRMAAYRGALRRLGGERTPENIRQAMREAQEITTNFSRKGAGSESIEKVIPYSNAAIQGIRRFAKQFKQNPVKTMAAVTTLVLVPKIYEYARFGDDPDYQSLPAREKYRNLIIGKNADGTFIKIPMPPEYNALGASMVDMLRAYKDGDPVNWRMSADAIVNAYTPPFLSGALQGVTQGGGFDQSLIGAINSTSLAAPVAVASNQSFTGAPIVPQRLEGRSPQYQYDERTSAIGKAIGEQLGMSPMKVDYLLRAYGGDPARLLLPLTSEVGAGNTRNTLLKNFIVDPTFTNTLSEEFYNAKERLSQAKKDLADVGAEPPSWYSEELAKLVTSTAKGSVSKRLSDLSKQKREVSASKALSAEEKTQRLRDIQAQINQIYLDVNSRLAAAGVPMHR